MATSLDEHMLAAESDDEFTIEYIEYDPSDDVQSFVQQHNLRMKNTISVQTVEDNDDDEYTYEEEIIEVAMGDKGDDMDSAAAPPPLPKTTTRSQKDFSPIQVSPVASPTNFQILSPSKQRAREAGSSGLSELSKQLRMLQAKNESQAVDIHRLERQLRILSDLQGISVSDLRKALEEACASEAFGELQHKVSKLRYELEAATLAKQQELSKDAMAPHIANLELKVGELEEVEEKHRKEIRTLYENLRRETSKSTKLESENQQLKQALHSMIQKCQSETKRASELESKYLQQVHDQRDRQSKVIQEKAGRSTDKSKGSSANLPSQLAQEYEQMVQLLKEKDAELREAQTKLHANEITEAKHLLDAEERAHNVQMDLKVESEKLALTVKELEDAECQNALRLAQYKARFLVQDERIEDMGQQLDSLYTAFTLMKEEFDSQSDRHATMLSNLNDADAEIARQTNQKEQKDHAESENNHSMDAPPSPSENYHRSSTALHRVAPMAPATPVTNREYHSHSYDTPIINEYEIPATYATARPFHPTPERTPSTWDLLFPNGQHLEGDSDQQDQHESDQQVLISGPLIVESNSVLRKWKSKPCKIYMRGEGYQWEIGHKRSFPIQFGISKVEFHPNYPLSFKVNLDPSMNPPPVIRAAALNESDYHRWMKALYQATSGEEYEGGPTPMVLPAPLSTTRRMQESLPSSRRLRTPHTITTSTENEYTHPYLSPSTQRSVRSEDDLDDQEVADLERVLELSRIET